MKVDTIKVGDQLVTTLTLTGRQDVQYHNQHFLDALNALEDIESEKVVGITLIIARLE